MKQVIKERLWLKNARLRKDLTRGQLAERLGISEKCYEQIEQGDSQKKLDLALVRKLSLELGMMPNQIMKADSDTFFLVDADTMIAIDEARNMIDCILCATVDEETKENALSGVYKFLNHICNDIEKNEIKPELSCA